MSRIRISQFVLLLAAALLCGSACAADLSGTWAGRWEDDGSGHNGPLRAKITRNCDGSYHCLFCGRFAKIIPFMYQTDLEVVSEDEACTHLHGTTKLPLFGDFHYDAVASDCDFTLNFCAKKYTGTFTLSRRSWFVCE